MLALAGLAVPAFATNPPGTPSAGQQYRDQWTQIGAEAIKLMWGTSHNAFGKCVSKTTKTLNPNANAANAACKTCDRVVPLDATTRSQSSLVVRCD
jgi:hypothetical protein